MTQRVSPQRKLYIPPSLPDMLAERWPDRCPDPKDDERTIWRNVGAAEVIRHLRELVDQQVKNDME